MERVIHEGCEYTLEWYYDSRGRSQALEYFNALPPIQKRKALHLFVVMGDFGKIHDITKFRNEDDTIYAFKPQPDRFLCFFFKGKKIIVTNAFKKTQDKLPLQEKNKALQYKEDYEVRVKRGTYYG
ncbi:type II toxin-antitoxin system RelE/ParE family toxin [Chlamydiota bacterium]